MTKEEFIARNCGHCDPTALHQGCRSCPHFNGENVGLVLKILDPDDQMPTGSRKAGQFSWVYTWTQDPEEEE